MNRIVIIGISLLILFSCANVDIIRIPKDKTTRSTQDATDDITIQSVPARNLALLFFSSWYFESQTTNKTTSTIQPKKQINPDDYRVIVDWMKDGVRHIKIKNNKTRTEYIVKEGDRSGSIILLERNLFSYRFLIEGVEVKISR